MDPELQKKIDSGEYSISPRSGRLRKRVRVKKKKILSKRQLKQIGRVTVWVVLIIAFIVSLILVIPELNLESDKKPAKSDKAK